MSSPTEQEPSQPTAESIASAASELNNLLQIISGTSALIGKEADGGEASEQYLGTLRSSIERAEKVAADLARQAGGAEEKTLWHPDLAPFVRSKKETEPAPRNRSILLVD